MQKCEDMLLLYQGRACAVSEQWVCNTGSNSRNMQSSNEAKCLKGRELYKSGLRISLENQSSSVFTPLQAGTRACP